MGPHGAVDSWTGRGDSPKSSPVVRPVPRLGDNAALRALGEPCGAVFPQPGPLPGSLPPDSGPCSMLVVYDLTSKFGTRD